jgi:hypothetical protein
MIVPKNKNHSLTVVQLANICLWLTGAFLCLISYTEDKKKKCYLLGYKITALRNQEVFIF